MGAWGHGPLDNDDALDFVGGLANDPQDGVIAGLRSAMTGVLENEDYIDSSDMASAIAAATLVAARVDATVPLSGNGRYYLEKMAFTVDGELRELAARVFTRAFQPDRNEWYDLWTEGGSGDEVTAALAPYRTAAAD